MLNPESTSTVAVFSRFLAGEQQAATEIHDRFAGKLRRIAQRLIGPRLGRRADADDALQSAFRTFFVGATEGKFAINESGQLWRLLVTITRHKVQRLGERHTSARRDVRRESRASAEDGVHARRQTESPDLGVELQDEVEWLIRELPGRDAEILFLGLSGSGKPEIASDVGCSVHTVRRVLKRAGQLLAERLEVTTAIAHTR